MTGANPTISDPAQSRRISQAAINAPRVIMSWEDWLTFAAAAIALISVAVSVQQAEWVRNMPPIVPVAIAGLAIGLFAVRLRVNGLLIQPLALALGVVVVVLAAQSYADGDNLSERLTDFRLRLVDWWHVVRAGDISNDNLPFVTLVEAVAFLFCYAAAWSIYRWHNAWLAILPAGFVLLSNTSFQSGQPSEAFVIFLFGSLLLISRLHVQSNQARWEKECVEYPTWMSLNTLNLTTLLAIGLLIVAWVVPLGSQAAAAEGFVRGIIRPIEGQTEHLFRLFHNVDSKRGKLHGFGDTLPVQGTVSLSSKPLLEVRSTEGGVIRATSYNEYTGNGWKSTDRKTQRIEGGVIAPADDASGNYQARAVTVLTVTVIDRESTVLTPGTPIGANVSTFIETPGNNPGDIEKMRSRRSLGRNDIYNSVGSISVASEEQLQGAGTAYPDWVAERYLQLPSDLPERVREEARQVVAGTTSSYDQAVAIEDYLRQLPFDLSVEAAPPGRDVVDFLLFDLQAGYFDYQASAMAVMLRSLGIPARIAVGYVLDPEDEIQSRYTVRKDDAYAWVEVFFPEYGWINFNPTRDRPAGGAGELSSFFSDEEIILIDPESLIPTDEELLGNPFINEALLEPPDLADEGFTVPWTLIFIVAGVLAVLAATTLSGRIAWNWGLSGLDGRAAMWEKVQRLARFTGFRSRPSETPQEWASRLGSGVGHEDEAANLSAAYEESRYGRPDLVRVDEGVAEESYRSLRNTLTKMLLRRGQKPPAEDPDRP